MRFKLNPLAPNGISIADEETKTVQHTSIGSKGADGVGVPAGGTTGQVLKKSTDTSYETEWGMATPLSDEIVTSATPTINTDITDSFTITALSEDITSFTTNLSGTPVDFQKLLIRIKDDSTPRSITWGSAFENKGVSLPTITTANKTLTIGLIYDNASSKWGCVAYVVEA